MVVDRYYFQDDIAFVVAAVPIGLLDIEVVVLSMDTDIVVAAVELGLRLVGDKSVVVDIDFDLVYMPVHFGNMVVVAVVFVVVVVDIVVERIPNELDLQVVRATNWVDFEL